MTALEQLIRRAVITTTTTTLSASAEKIAEDFARDLLNEPGFREDMRAIIRRECARTATALRDEPPDTIASHPMTPEERATRRAAIDAEHDRAHEALREADLARKTMHEAMDRAFDHIRRASQLARDLFKEDRDE